MEKNSIQKLKMFQEGKGLTFQNFILIVVIAIAFAITALLSKNFLTTRNIINIFQQFSITGIVAIAAAVIIISRGVDLSVGSMIAMVTCVMAVLYNKQGFDLWLAVVIGVLIAVLAGFVNGIIISSTKAEPFIVTLGMMSVFNGAALVITGGL